MIGSGHALAEACVDGDCPTHGSPVQTRTNRWRSTTGEERIPQTTVSILYPTYPGPTALLRCCCDLGESL
jgi:hypothetical protein